MTQYCEEWIRSNIDLDDDRLSFEKYSEHVDIPIAGVSDCSISYVQRFLDIPMCDYGVDFVFRPPNTIFVDMNIAVVVSSGSLYSLGDILAAETQATEVFKSKLGSMTASTDLGWSNIKTMKRIFHAEDPSARRSRQRTRSLLLGFAPSNVDPPFRIGVDALSRDVYIEPIIR